MRKITLPAAMLAMTLALGGCTDHDYDSGYYYNSSSYSRYPIYNDADFTARYTTGYNNRYYWGY